jgi:hypothetical protein
MAATEGALGRGSVEHSLGKGVVVSEKPKFPKPLVVPELPWCRLGVAPQRPREWAARYRSLSGEALGTWRPSLRGRVDEALALRGLRRAKPEHSRLPPIVLPRTELLAPELPLNPLCR